MSITIGFYDLFSYTVPGMLYLFTINQLLAVIKFPHFSVGEVDLDIGTAVLGLILSYVAGSLMDTFAYRWYLIFHKSKVEQNVIENFKRTYPDLNIDFAIHDRRMAFSFIKHNNLEMAETIGKFKALSIMLQNISFGLFLLSIVQIINLILSGFSAVLLAAMLTALIFSYVAVHRSALYNYWYWSGIFEQALHYGKSVSDMFSKYEKEEQRSKGRKQK